MKTKYLVYLLSAIVALTFTACGGGSSADFEGTSTSISVVDCNSSTDITDYTELLSGDVIVKDESPTEISTYHDIDGNKRVCVDIGAAHIVR